VDNANVFDYVFDKYLQSFEDAGKPLSKTAKNAASKFTEFAKEHFQTNTPISLSFEDTGMGFQLQDGTHLTFVEQVDSTAPYGAGAVPVTASMASRSGMQNMRVVDDSVAVTDGKGIGK
tara:strand:- start:2577 stop:2933 length:357 start_codon:yes stop_codon:yes gene_type:complete